MSRHILLGLFCLVLSSCGTIEDGGAQKITVETPGANDAVCYISNNHLKYRLFTPGSVVVSKRPGDLTVNCLADGNRERTVVYSQDINKTTYGNVLTAGLGAGWDYETGGMFEYPEKIVVDFTNIPSKPMELPNYHKHIKDNPDLYGMEEFRPGRAALIRDAYDTPDQLQRREVLPGQQKDSLSGFTESDGTADTAEIISSSDIGKAPSRSSSNSSSNANDTASALTRSMNPNVFGSGAAVPPASSSGGFIGGTNTNEDR